MDVNNGSTGPKVTNQEYKAVSDGVLEVTTDFQTTLQFTADSIRSQEAQLKKQQRQLLAEKRKLDQALGSISKTLEDLADIRNIFEEKFGPIDSESE